MEDWELVEGVFGPPEYEPVAFEDLEIDKFYYVRMTTHVLSFSDMILLTYRKNEREVRSYLIASRKYKRVHEGEMKTVDDVSNNEAENFHTFPYALNEAGGLIPAPWTEHPLDPPLGPLSYNISKNHIKMEIGDTEYGYVFFKKVEDEGAVAAPASINQVGEEGRRRRHTRRRRTRRGRAHRRVRHSQRR